MSAFEKLGIYEYRADGRYPPATWVETPQGFAEMIPRLQRHIGEGRELRITDTSDRLLFHAEKGAVKWDGLGIGELLEASKAEQRMSFEEYARRTGYKREESHKAPVEERGKTMKPKV